MKQQHPHKSDLGKSFNSSVCLITVITVTLSVESIAFTYKMSRTLLHVAYKDFQRNNRGKLLKCKLSILQIITVFLTYSDFTVSVAYSTKKITFSVQFFEIACKLSVTWGGGDIHILCVMGIQ